MIVTEKAVGDHSITESVSTAVQFTISHESGEVHRSIVYQRT